MRTDIFWFILRLNIALALSVLGILMVGYIYLKGEPIEATKSVGRPALDAGVVCGSGVCSTHVLCDGGYGH